MKSGPEFSQCTTESKLENLLFLMHVSRLYIALRCVLHSSKMFISCQNMYLRKFPATCDTEDDEWCALAEYWRTARRGKFFGVCIVTIACELWPSSFVRRAIDYAFLLIGCILNRQCHKSLYLTAGTLYFTYKYAVWISQATVFSGLGHRINW